MDKIDLVVKRIDDLKESTEKKLDLIKESTENRLDIYNELLKEHIKRTNILEKLHEDNQESIENNQKRLEMLEEPVKAKEYIRKLVLKLAGFATAIFGLYKILEHFGI